MLKKSLVQGNIITGRGNYGDTKIDVCVQCMTPQLPYIVASYTLVNEVCILHASTYTRFIRVGPVRVHQHYSVRLVFAILS